MSLVLYLHPPLTTDVFQFAAFAEAREGSDTMAEPRRAEWHRIDSVPSPEVDRPADINDASLAGTTSPAPTEVRRLVSDHYSRYRGVLVVSETPKGHPRIPQ